MEAMRMIPKGAVKVADKNSDAVAYLYEQGGAPCGRVYFGKQSKPVLAYRFANEAARAKTIAAAFKSRQERDAVKAAIRADRQATGRGVEVGQYLVASWGYDQTNVNFYKVVALIGKSMAEVIAVPGIMVGNEGGSSMSSKVIPAEDPLPGAKSYRVQVKAGRATINGNRASTWDGKPEYTSWYA